ncbi:MAG: radical SAM protein [Mariprofundaceae bacterium]|nr:radical SAM protein [Mariprofundaceae bacterium]
MPASDLPAVRIHEIYDSIQGESTLAGMPCTLVRLAGCPLRCNYCDTPQAMPFNSGEEYSIEQITEKVRQHKRPLTLVSGGEPLAQKSCLPLLSALANISPVLQLETSGAFDISQTDPGVRRILDVKTPGSGESRRNRRENFHLLKDGDEIKFVITSHADYLWAVSILDRYPPVVPVLFSPAWGNIQPSDLAAWILEDHLPARMQLQLHKYIWGAEATGV